MPHGLSFPAWRTAEPESLQLVGVSPSIRFPFSQDWTIMRAVLRCYTPSVSHIVWAVNGLPYIMFQSPWCGYTLLTFALSEQLMHRRQHRRRLSSLGDYSLWRLMGQGWVTWRAEQPISGCLLSESGPSLARDEAVSTSWLAEGRRWLVNDARGSSRWVDQPFPARSDPRARKARLIAPVLPGWDAVVGLIGLLSARYNHQGRDGSQS